MPFICLANANVPDGSLQVTDLWPNVSQDNNPTNPPGQTRYVNRIQNEGATIDPNLGTVVGVDGPAAAVNINGLQAYLIDRVHVGALEQSSAALALAANPAANDRIVFALTMYFEFTAGVNDATTAGTALAPFNVQIGANTTVTMANLVAVMNAAAAKNTMRPLLPANIYPAAVAAGPPDNTCIINAMFDSGPGEVALLGGVGDLAVTLPVVGSSARITVPTTGRMGRLNERWNPTNLAAASAALLNLIDTGADATLAAVDALLNLQANGACDLAGAGATSVSSGTLAELLSLFAGRGYRLDAGLVKFTAAAAPDTVRTWVVTQLGGFTTAHQVFDTNMSGGVIAPAAPWTKHKGASGAVQVTNGGDTENREIKGVRNTYDSTDFQASMDAGQLAGFASGVITLFPDSDTLPHIPTTYQKAVNIQDPILNQRLVTVYDDDGTALV